ncbi:DUF3105 domain-containing protein [Cohnella kolymensis]|uniref:DUF3105 domain-containing protein n=1 Tax=Cohnella kolymensis TaxID=1590652 RepID=UPI000696DE57|nr:DUF3105 domain-containing protein [Cohnella kolymensis]
MAYILLYISVVLFVVSLLGYWYASKLNKENTSRLKKEQKAALKKKGGAFRFLAHTLMVVAILLAVIFFVQLSENKYDIESLNYNVTIDVTDDKNYGAGHTDDPVQYEMKIPTSGIHSPHDLKFGYYTERPGLETLVHNLEHGDIIIHYRPDLESSKLDVIKYLSHFRKAGAGVLAVPNENVPEGKDVVLTAWTKTMELDSFDVQKAGKFIYEYINQGPEKIPANVRRGGGTM